MFSGIDSDIKPVPLNALSPILVICQGISNDVKLLHFSNVLSGIDFNWVESFTLVNDIQFLNNPIPIVFTELGIIIDCKPDEENGGGKYTRLCCTRFWSTLDCYI